MTQDQYSVTLNQGNFHARPDLPIGPSRLARTLQHLLWATGLALIFLCIEGCVWIWNPLHLFGMNASHSFLSFLLLFVSKPILLLFVLLEILLAFWLVITLAQPLARLAYLRAVYQAQEHYRARFTSLPDWAYPYDVPIVSYQDDPDPRQPRQMRYLTLPELIKEILGGTLPYLLLLGQRGSGKSMFLHEYLSTAAQQRLSIAFGRHKLPVLLSLKYYAHCLQESGMTNLEEYSFLDFLAVSVSPGIEHVRPYLRKLFRQGRLLLLCDGLDEVESYYRPVVERELRLVLLEQRNHLLVAGTPESYAQFPELAQDLVGNLVPSVEFQVLELPHMRTIVERFVSELDVHTHAQLPTAGQIMHMLESTRLRLLCKTPLYLFALLDLIDTPTASEAKHLDTRGRLLREFLLDRLASTSQANEAVPEDIFLLGDLACIARWQIVPDLLRLPALVAGYVGAKGTAYQRSQPGDKDALERWLEEQPVYFPFSTEHAPVLGETFGPEEVISSLRRSALAGLVDCDASGLLVFRHPIVASALLAEYLARYLGTSELRVEVVEAFPEDLAAWSEPLTLWAGLLEQPLVVADELANRALEFAHIRVGALVLAMICLGVVQTPPGTKRQTPIFVPPTLATALLEVISDPSVSQDLATSFMNCATTGSPELFQALFPLLEVSGLEPWLSLLDASVTADLFLQRLILIIDDPEQEALVKRLVRVIGGYGAAVVPQATRLSSSSTNARLRTAAINILGGTQASEAVPPLLVCLRDSDKFIVNRAANALTRLGPDVTLDYLLPALREPVDGQSLHWIILLIFERYFNESHPERQFTPAQFEQVIAVLMTLLGDQSMEPAVLQKAQELLVSQGRLAGERESGKLAINLLVKNLTVSEERVARSMSGTLKEVGSVATPHLLEQLELQTSEGERMRILEVLTSVRDPRALPALLRLLEDDSSLVQSALIEALRVHIPESIAGLIEILLHHKEQFVAVRAQQVLVSFGEVVLEPVIAALHPLQPERTSLLVHILESIGDPQAVSPLIDLLEPAQGDVALTLALIQALGQLPDARVVDPLLQLLDSANPLLYEEAINALSHLGELACPSLLARLDVSEKTPVVTRIERVFLGMQPFPATFLLEAVEKSSSAQASYLSEIFLANGAEAAHLLATNLFYAKRRTREWVRQTLSRMDGYDAIPALLEVLNRPDPAWQELLASYLLNYSDEAISPLVDLLDDPERGEAAMSILLRCGSGVFLALVPALNSRGVMQSRARQLLLTLVRLQPELLPAVIQLFAQALPEQVLDILEQSLAEDLADMSLPALLAGLEDTHVLPGVSVTLLRFARRNPAQGNSALTDLLQALRIGSRRYGAAQTLVGLGSLAVTGVGGLINDADPQVAQSARHILSEIGTPAFPFLWAAHSDTSNPARREAARAIFRTMPTATIQDELVHLLTSARQDEISMALALLLERIHDESLQPGYSGEMLSSLLEYVQSSHNQAASSRILALLVLLGGPIVTNALLTALKARPDQHEALLQTFLFLESEVEQDLLEVLHNSQTAPALQAEVAGILAMRTPQQDVIALAHSLSQYGLWAGRSGNTATTVLQPEQLAISLRTLGGLLVAGHWNPTTLQQLRMSSKPGSMEHELYEMLLGWRYNPQLSGLEQDLAALHAEHRQTLFSHMQELTVMKLQMSEVEAQLEELERKHEAQATDHMHTSKELQEEIQRLTRENQALNADLRDVRKEKVELVANSRQDNARLVEEKERWQKYGQQLERELATLRRTQTNP